MTRLFFCLVLTAFATEMFGQQTVKNYVSSQLIQMRTIDAADTEFDDLEKIGDLIGDKRVVMLGELTHGDGNTFAAKARLVRYLHEKKGFNVLAFESDFVGINNSWPRVPRRELALDTFLVQSVMSLWTMCQQASPLFRYLSYTQKENTPIQVTGFDCQVSSAQTRKLEFKKDLKRYLSISGLFDGNEARQDSFFHYIDLPLAGSSMLSVLPDSILNARKWIREAIQKLSNQGRQDNFYTQALVSLDGFCEAAISAYRGRTDKSGMNVYGGVRDRYMAQNLQWIWKHLYPAEKIIVWAHNLHVNKGDNATTNYKLNRFPAMASYLHKDSSVRDNIYSIAFTGYKGIIKPVTVAGSIPLIKAKKGSIEDLIHDHGFEFAYLDLTMIGESKKTQIKGHQYFMRVENDGFISSDWAASYDALFYIREMVPCEPIPARDLKKWLN